MRDRGGDVAGEAQLWEDRADPFPRHKTGCAHFAPGAASSRAGRPAIHASISLSSQPTIPPPIDTVNVYGDVFGQIALVAIGSAVICFALAPLLKKWMHEEAFEAEEKAALPAADGTTTGRLSA